MTLSTLLMTTSYMARPHAATADRRPQGRRATNLMNVRSSCLSELFREHPLLQRARAVHCTATSGCDRGSSLCHPETLPVGTKAVPCTAHTASLARIGGTAGTPITEPHLAHSSRHNNRLLSHRSSDPQKCRTGYSRWFPPPAPHRSHAHPCNLQRNPCSPSHHSQPGARTSCAQVGDSRSPSGAGTLPGPLSHGHGAAISSRPRGWRGHGFTNTRGEGEVIAKSC